MKKIIANIILFTLIFTIFVPFINYDNGIRCITTPCPADATGSIALYLIKGLPNIYSINYINLIIGIIISIILAYIIIFTINKINNHI